MLLLTVWVGLNGMARGVPPGAAALGYTLCVINEHPTASDVAPGSSGACKWFSGQWWESPPPLTDYSTASNVLVLSLGGDLVSTPRNFSAGALPVLPGSNGFYVEFDVQLSDNDPDHWPAVWLMPVEHNARQQDHYPGDPPGFERWMELDVDEGGFGPGLCGTVHSWTGIYPNYANSQNLNNESRVALDRTRIHTFGASYDPGARTVAWWVDGARQMSAGPPYVPAVAALQHFYLILSAQTHGQNIPYSMSISGVRAYLPPPPVVSISPAVRGLNLFTGLGAALINPENIQSANGANYSWVGASGPVSYSFTINNYSVAATDLVQCGLFLIPNPGTEADANWIEPNVVFMDLEGTTRGGAEWSFRYKTNSPGGYGSMIYGRGTLASIGSPTVLGTWTVTFDQNTNVSMTIPGGASTNFSIPDSTGATTALFAGGVDIYFGVQANNAGGANDHIVASDFKVTGLGPADFDDNFVADAGILESNIWTVNASFRQCVILVGPADPYWIQWTTPASGYTLETAASLSPDITWTPVTANAPFNNGAFYTQLISTNDLPPGNSAFFRLAR